MSEQQADPAPPADGEKAVAAGAGASATLPVLALAAALAAVVLAGLLWFQGRGADDALRREVAQRLAEASARDQAAAAGAERTAAALREAEIKIGVLESKLAESQSQQIALEALYQELSRNRDEWTFAEVEQSILLASQQLQVAGNARAALIGLENAEARLQRIDQPRYNLLRRAIGRDIDRLKALPLADIHGNAARLDDAIGAVDRLPLAMEARPRQDSPQPAAAAAELPAWQRMAHEAWRELRQLVRIQRSDAEDATLLAPEQAFFLRENLKLRLLGARVALLSRDARSYQADLRAASAMIERHFDPRDATVAATVSALRKLQGAQVEIALPDLGETLEALRKLRTSRGKPAG